MTQTYAMPEDILSVATPAGIDPARVKQIWNMQPGPLPLSQVINVERANQLWIWSGSFYTDVTGGFRGLTLKIDGVDTGFVGMFYNPINTHLAPPATFLKTALGVGNHTVSVVAGSVNVLNDSGDRHSLLLIELENTQQLITIRSQPPVVTSLPANPEHGQEVYFQNAAMATDGLMWHLKYNSASASPYKWEYVGGAPMHHERTDQQGPSTSTTYVVIGFGPTLTLPLAGDYMLHFGVRGQGSVATAIVQWGFQRNGVDPADVDTLLLQPPGVNYAFAGFPVWHQRANGLPAGLVLRAVGKTNAGNFTIYHRWLSATPVRVG